MEFIDRFDKLVAAALLVFVREQAPLGACPIEGESDELPGKLRFFYFHFHSVRCETKRTACGIIWILIATHCLYLWPDKMTDPGRFSDAKLFCRSLRADATREERMTLQRQTVWSSVKV